MKQLTNKDQITLLKIKSLLNDLSYLIKEEEKPIVDDFYTLCRKYCSWGGDTDDNS